MEDLSLTSLLLRGGAVLILLAANAFFVAAEFALVTTRRVRIETMVRQGDQKAKTVQVALQDLYRQLSAAQLGITLASIMLGYVAEDTVAVVLHIWIEALPPALAFLGRAAVVSVVAVAVITFLHVVIGEQAPKAWAISNPEDTSRWAARPLMIFARITTPATNLLNWSANGLLRLMGIGSPDEHRRIHTPEEIVMMVRQTQLHGHLDKEDVEMIEGVFEFTEKRAQDVMTPRTDMVMLPATTTVADAVATVSEFGRSRYPVYDESPDNIVGIVHVKQILSALGKKASDPITSIMRKPIFVPGTREVEDVLADMKRLKSQMAVVLDEYGGTAGIVTMEDLLEEIVGEIYDEYETGDPQPRQGVDGVILPGDMDIEDLNAEYGLELTDDDYQTIGGFLFGQLGRLPKTGDEIVHEGTRFEILEMDNRRVRSVKMLGPAGEHDAT